MAFPLSPVDGQRYEDTATSRLWTWNSSVNGWIPNDIDVLDDLKDVVTDTTTSLDAETTIASRASFTAVSSTLDSNNTQNYLRDTFVLLTDTRINSIDLTLTKNSQLTSGIVNVQIYRNVSTGNVAAASWAGVSAALGAVVLTSNYIEASTITGTSTFTFNPNVLQPGSYTFVVRTFNLDSTLTMPTGLNGTLTELLFSIKGQVATGSVQTGDVLTYNGVQLQWEAKFPYGGSGTYVPIVIDATSAPTAANVETPGTFWRNTLTQRVWISRGSGRWWSIPPTTNTYGVAVATRSSTAPTAPANGRMWFNDTNARLYMWDNEATAWIEI